MYFLISHNDGAGDTLRIKTFQTRDEAVQYMYEEIEELADNRPIEWLLDGGNLSYDNDGGWFESYGVMYEWAITDDPGVNELEDKARKLQKEKDTILADFQAFVECAADASNLDIPFILDAVCNINEDNAEEFGFGWVFETRKGEPNA